MTAIASRSRAQSAALPGLRERTIRPSMQLVLRSPMPDASPAVFTVNGEKPHQGVTGKNPGLHQRFAACNSTTALGVSWGQWSGTAPGATVSFEYDAFGNEISSTGTTPNEFLYRGEQYDSKLDLYYMRARFYNPQIGRFMSRDPQEGNPTAPTTLHRYLYAGDDPVNRVDPNGRDDFLEEQQTDRALIGWIKKGYAALASDEEKLLFCTGLTSLWMFNNPDADPIDALLYYEYCLARVNGNINF